MLIDRAKCRGCNKCLLYCPMGAIESSDDKAFINRDLCVECGVCKRVSDCPTDAFIEELLEWPRTIRKILSDPLTTVPETKITGRGTEEMKTNEITGRIKHGEVGFAIDVGRPNVGTRLAEFEKITVLLSGLDLSFEKENPITLLMKDTRTGLLVEEVRNEIVMSGIIEFKAKVELLNPVLEVLRHVSTLVDTTFTLGVIVRVDESGSIPILQDLKDAGWDVSPCGKVNIGLGRAADQ
jgi:NAD-dependent dihydropyrimidine dehydrogenase PreA subunit